MKYPILLLVAAICMSLIGNAAFGYTIDNTTDKVYISDENVYISASPITAKSGQNVTLNVKHNLSNPVTVYLVFGFDSTQTKPVKLYAGQNGGQLNDITGNFEKVTGTWDGKDKWYRSNAVTLQPNVLYEGKMELKVIGREGKYDFAIYPSSYGDNVGNAIQNGHFYLLDPWYNSSMDYKVLNNISYATGTTLTNFPYLINGSTGFNFGSPSNTQYIWSSSNINATNYIYYDNNSNYQVVNSTENGLIGFEVEKGNVTSYNQSTIFDANYVAVYHFGGGGTQINDSSRYGHNLTPVGSPTYNTTDYIGTSYSSTGGGANAIYLSTFDTTKLNITENVTIEAVIRVNGYAASTTSGILSKGNLAFGKLVVAISSAGKVFCRVSDGSSWDLTVTSTASLSNGTWYHIGCSWSDAAGWRLFVNGVLNETADPSGRELDATTGNLSILTAKGEKDFVGTITELRISDVTRSDSWLRASYLSMMSTLSQLGAASNNPAGINFDNVTINPSSTGFGEQATISANISAVTDSIDKVKIEIYNPLNVLKINNVSMTQTTTTYVYYAINLDQADFMEGTWTAKIWANTTTNNISSTTKTFTQMNRTINITFDANVSATVQWLSGTTYYPNVTNIFNQTTAYATGQILITFGSQNQKIYFYNDLEKSYWRNVTVVSTAADITQEGYIVSDFGNVPNTVIDLYMPVNGTYKLYQSALSSENGFWSSKVISGVYLFVVNETGYDYYAKLKPVSTNTLYLRLNKESSLSQGVLTSTDCPLKTVSPVTCKVKTRTIISATTVRYLYYLNGIYQTPITYNNVSNTNEAVFELTLTAGNYEWNITTEVDGVNMSRVYTSWDNLTGRDIQIDVPTGTINREELPFIILIILMVASVAGAVSNWMVKGSGIYIFAAVLSLFASFTPALWSGALVAGYLIIIEAAKRLIG